MMAMINPNDESTLTSASGNTPMPADNTCTKAAAASAHNVEDMGLTKFPSAIYADDNDNMMSESFAQEQSYHTELTGSISDSNSSREEASATADDEDAAACLVVPEEVTCHDDILSLSDDKSMDASSPVKCRRSPSDPVSPLSTQQTSPQMQLHHEDEETISEDDQQKANNLLTSSTDSQNEKDSEFVSLRITYLIVTLVIMLADGLQGMNLSTI